MKENFLGVLRISAICLLMFAFDLGGAPSARGDDDDSNSTFQAKNMFVFGNPAMLLPGAATLIRTDDGISFRVYTSGLSPGAHTLWIVIFNKPQNCAGGPGACLGPDLGNPAVKGSIVYGTGYSVGDDGVGNFQGSLAEGPPEAGRLVNVPAGLVNGLKNAKKAEIHLVVRDHGPIMAGAAVDQFTTFEAGCGVCQDEQAVIFEAVPNGDDDD